MNREKPAKSCPDLCNLRKILIKNLPLGGQKPAIKKIERGASGLKNQGEAPHKY
jgi:hypothetical protein